MKRFGAPNCQCEKSSFPCPSSPFFIPSPLSSEWLGWNELRFAVEDKMRTVGPMGDEAEGRTFKVKTVLTGKCDYVM